MIRSCRIPSVLRRICTDNVIQTALLVTTDGELLGSTATTFLSPDGTTKESIESLGTLIADIAIDYGRLGEEYANLDPTPLPNAQQPAGALGSNTTNISTNNAPSSSSSASIVGNSQQQQQQLQQQQQQLQPSSSSSSSTPPPKRSSHLQCLLLELELGLVAVSACVGVDCMVIAIAAPSAPLGSIRARLQAITAHVQEALSPLAMTEATPYREMR